MIEKNVCIFSGKTYKAKGYLWSGIGKVRIGFSEYIDRRGGPGAITMEEGMNTLVPGRDRKIHQVYFFADAKIISTLKLETPANLKLETLANLKLKSS